MGIYEVAWVLMYERILAAEVHPWRYMGCSLKTNRFLSLPIIGPLSSALALVLSKDIFDIPARGWSTSKLSRPMELLSTILARNSRMLSKR